MAITNKKTSNAEQLNKHVQRYASSEELLLMRNLSYAASATCFVILMGLIQVGTKELPIQVSAIAASIGLPSWLLIGSIFENYVFVGRKSFPHFRTRFARHFLGAFLLIAGFSIFSAVGGIVYYLSIEACLIFVIMSVTCFFLMSVYQSHLGEWWASKNGKENSEESDE